MPAAVEPYPTEGGLALVSGVAVKLSLNAVRTLSHDLAKEVRLMRLHGDDCADALQEAVDRLNATAAQMQET